MNSATDGRANGYETCAMSRSWVLRTGCRSTRACSRETGTVSVTFSVTTYLRSRARPTSSERVPTFRRSSERVIALSVVGPEVSRPTGGRDSKPAPCWVVVVVSVLVSVVVPVRDEGLLGAEQAGADGDPLRLARLVVEIDLRGRPDLLAGLVVDVLADHAADGVGADHLSRSYPCTGLVRSLLWV